MVTIFDRNLGMDLTEEIPVINKAVAADPQSLFPDCMTTVSYTHLDVYKRQVLNGVIHRQALGLVDFGLVSFGIYMRILRIICGGKQQEK